MLAGAHVVASQHLQQSNAFVDSAEEQSRAAVDAKAEQWTAVEQRRSEQSRIGLGLRLKIWAAASSPVAVASQGGAALEEQVEKKKTHR